MSNFFNSFVRFVFLRGIYIKTAPYSREYSAVHVFGGLFSSYIIERQAFKIRKMLIYR